MQRARLGFTSEAETEPLTTRATLGRVGRGTWQRRHSQYHNASPRPPTRARASALASEKNRRRSSTRSSGGPA